MINPFTLVTLERVEVCYDRVLRADWLPVEINGVPIDPQSFDSPDDFLVGPTKSPILSFEYLQLNPEVFTEDGVYNRNNPLLSPGARRVICALYWRTGECVPLVDRDGFSFITDTILEPEMFQDVYVPDLAELSPGRVMDYVFSWTGVNLQRYRDAGCPMEFKYSPEMEKFSAGLDLSGIADEFGNEPSTDAEFYNKVIDFDWEKEDFLDQMRDKLTA